MYMIKKIKNSKGKYGLSLIVLQKVRETRNKVLGRENILA